MEENKELKYIKRKKKINRNFTTEIYSQEKLYSYLKHKKILYATTIARTLLWRTGLNVIKYSTNVKVLIIVMATRKVAISVTEWQIIFPL
jgi:hypothetical protein